MAKASIVKREKASTRKRGLTVSLVGPGNLGTALATALPPAGFEVRTIAVPNAASARRRETKELARSTKAGVIVLGREPLDTDIVWITVPDDTIADVARRLASAQTWKGRTVFHSSGALSSDELAPLREQGARVASVHPMMSFVRGSIPQMSGVAFALEGDAAALRVAQSIVRALGGNGFTIEKDNKVLYHAFGSFASPLVIALMAAMEQVAEAAGIRKDQVKPIMVPLLWQTLRNYLYHDAQAAFSGPLIRGDVATIRKHLAELQRTPDARQVYVSLARAAVKNLTVKNREALESELSDQ